MRQIYKTGRNLFKLKNGDEYKPVAELILFTSEGDVAEPGTRNKKEIRVFATIDVITVLQQYLAEVKQELEAEGS